MTKYKSPHFIQWIRNQYCCFCGSQDRWDGVNDLPINTPFHLKTRGSGGEDYYNTVPSCTRHHIKYENNVRQKEMLVELACKLTDEYFEKFPDKHEPYRKRWWKDVEEMQK